MENSFRREFSSSSQVTHRVFPLGIDDAKYLPFVHSVLADWASVDAEKSYHHPVISEWACRKKPCCSCQEITSSFPTDTRGPTARRCACRAACLMRSIVH